MAGIRGDRAFAEKISPFLRNKMESIKEEKGEDSPEYRALYFQYKLLDEELTEHEEDNRRHWEADMEVGDTDHALQGVERLYRRSVVIEPTMICAAHCRYCLRANYDIFTLREPQLEEIARFCGSEQVRDELKEVLITGGDPLILPQRLNYLIEAMLEHAPNVKIFRIGTRLFSQDPRRIDNNVFEIFRNKPSIRFEIATQLNHAVEFFSEAVEKIRLLISMGVKIYSQNVLLKHVNDNIEALVDLYDAMRDHDIEAHYLFHCVPMRGMHHLRTTLDEGLQLAHALTNSGVVSGRVKPMFALMTDIGKITLYEGTIVRRDDDNRVLLQSAYKYEDRMRENPSWQLPRTAEVDENGYLRVWYLDGT